MKKNNVRLTEKQLHNIIKESVKRIIREHEYDDANYYIAGEMVNKLDHEMLAQLNITSPEDKNKLIDAIGNALDTFESNGPVGFGDVDNKPFTTLPTAKGLYR